MIFANQAPSIVATRQSREEVLGRTIDLAVSLILSTQLPEGYWWYSLEANESINAERIFLNRYLGIHDPKLEEGLGRRLMESQRDDGSWPLYHGGPGDLSTTIECYFALKMVSNAPLPPLKVRGGEGELCLEKARSFILAHGGLSKCRVFTRIHLALFGLVPWEICPAMPPWLILFPSSFPINLYEFSSWARASIIPLLVIQAKKKTRPLSADFLDELYIETDRRNIDWSFHPKLFFSWESFFVLLDRLLHALDKFGIRFFEKRALKKCEQWIRSHLARTEDIYPAMAYGAMALFALGYPLSDPTIQKALKALDRFVIQRPEGLSALSRTVIARSETTKQSSGNQPDCHAPTGLAMTEYQQCCISPVWDSPWAGVALLESGVPRDSPELLKCARWLISKQIRDARGDWAVKNKKGIAGGWSFEFENDFFPDVDDTIQVIDFLLRTGLPEEGKKEPIRRGIDWLISMQSKNGGWGAFDLDNTKEFLNRIPFADHGACLDPPTPDITARAVGLLCVIARSETTKQSSCHTREDQRDCFAYARNDIQEAIQRGIRFVEKSQEADGSWWGRWGVNYLYGTWCVLDGLARAGYPMDSARIRKAVDWLKSVQNRDGGFGESCASYLEKRFIPLTESVPSQTAWGLLALVAAGHAKSPETGRAAAFLMTTQQSDGAWDEPHHTGTGFPGHFYIRYHGYRFYFPLLALARYSKSQS